MIWSTRPSIRKAWSPWPWSANTWICQTATSRSTRRCATRACATMCGCRSTMSTPRPSTAPTPQPGSPGTTPSSCPAASGSAAWKARSPRPAMRAPTKSPRHGAGLANATSTEFAPATPHPVIALITEWQDADGSIQQRDQDSNLGGTMRLGAQSSDVLAGTLAHRIYGDVVTERHRHRYEANVNYLEPLRKAGLVIAALTQREQLTEIVELPQSMHPWFIGVQFHPEFKS